MELSACCLGTVGSTAEQQQIVTVDAPPVHRVQEQWLTTHQYLPLWCDLGFVRNSRGNKAAANLRPNND